MSLSKSNLTTFPLELFLPPYFLFNQWHLHLPGCVSWTVTLFQDLIPHIKIFSSICQFCFLCILQTHLDLSHILTLAIWTIAVDSLLMSQLFLLHSLVYSVHCIWKEIFKDAKAIISHTLKPSTSDC